MKDPPRIYTYKVTFEEIPDWYWGSHKENKYEDGYLGSPETHAWKWEFYTPNLQILELFPYTEKGWKEAQNTEKRCIRPDLNNPLCLNEHCGGDLSLESCKRGGLIGGVSTVARGSFDVDSPNYIKTSESIKKGAILGGRSTATRGYLDVNSSNSIKTLDSLRKGASAQHSIRVRCKITGYVSTPCGLSHWQKARGINHLDPNNREKTNVEN